MKRIAVMLVALLCLVSIATPVSALEPAPKNNLFGVTYGMASADADFSARTPAVGISFEHYVVEDVSLEVGASWLSPENEDSQFSGAVGINYHFDSAYLGFRGGYNRVTEQFAVSAGPGLNFYAGPVNLRFAGLVNYALESGLEDRTSFTVEAAVRYRF